MCTADSGMSSCETLFEIQISAVHYFGFSVCQESLPKMVDEVLAVLSAESSDED